MKIETTETDRYYVGDVIRTRFGGLSRGKQWGRHVDSGEWATKSSRGVRLDAPGKWKVGSDDGFRRKESDVYIAHPLPRQITPDEIDAVIAASTSETVIALAVEAKDGKTMLYHSSPDTSLIVTEDGGRFGSFLFFNSEIVSGPSGACAAVYSIEEEELSFIEAGMLFYHDDAENIRALVKEYASKYDLSVDESEAQIEGGGDFICAESSWDAQLFAARAAVILGFDGVKVRDEHGTSYMIDCLNRKLERVQ